MRTCVVLEHGAKNTVRRGCTSEDAQTMQQTMIRRFAQQSRGAAAPWFLTNISWLEEKLKVCVLCVDQCQGWGQVKVNNVFRLVDIVLTFRIDV